MRTNVQSHNAGITAFGIALFLASASVFATGVASSDWFYEFYNTVNTMARGGFAIALAITAMLIGAILGVARASVMPALIGFAFAMVFVFGPKVILNIMGSSSLV